MLRRIALAAFWGLAVVSIGVPGWIAIHLEDASVPEDADLRVERPAIPLHEDGYESFVAAGAANPGGRDDEINEKLSKLLRREISDPAWVGERVRENARAFELLERGLGTPHFEIPVVVKSDYGLGWFFGVQHLVRIAAAESYDLAKQGDVASALERASLGLRVGRRLGSATGVHLMALINGYSMQSISLYAIERLLLDDLELSPAEARELARRLDAHRWVDDDWRRAWSTEYALLRTRFDTEIELPEVDHELKAISIDVDLSTPERLRRLLPQRFTLHPNRMLGQMADVYRELARKSSLACGEWRAAEDTAEALPSFEAEPGWRAYRDLFEPNHDGRTFVALMRASNERMLLMRCRSHARFSLVQSLAGINAYHHAKGGLPDSLDALAPDYLHRVPRDAFDGGQLRYSRSKGVVYALGEDLADQGAPDAASSIDRSTPAISVRHWLVD